MSQPNITPNLTQGNSQAPAYDCVSCGCNNTIPHDSLYRWQEFIKKHLYRVQGTCTKCGSTTTLWLETTSETVSETSKILTTDDEAVIGIIEYTDYKYSPNAWHYQIYVRVPADYPNKYKNSERTINSNRYIVINGAGGFTNQALATQQALITIGDMTAKQSN